MFCHYVALKRELILLAKGVVSLVQNHTLAQIRIHARYHICG